MFRVTVKTEISYGNNQFLDVERIVTMPFLPAHGLVIQHEPRSDILAEVHAVYYHIQDGSCVAAAAADLGREYDRTRAMGKAMKEGWHLPEDEEPEPSLEVEAE